MDKSNLVLYTKRKTVIENRPSFGAAFVMLKNRGCNMNCTNCFWRASKCNHPRPIIKVYTGKTVCLGYDNKQVLEIEFTIHKKEVAGMTR